MKKGSKHKPETLSKLSLSLTGRRMTEATKLKMSIASKGRIMSLESRKKLSNSRIGIKFTDEHRAKLGLAKKGIKRTEEEKRNISQKISLYYKTNPRWNIGISPSPETRIKISEGIKGRKGVRITPLNQRIRSSMEMKDWRNKVFERDNYTCQVCEKRGVELNAHHIKPFSKFPSLRFEINNGITLCVECHNESKGKEQWYEVELEYLNLLKWYESELLIESII